MGDVLYVEQFPFLVGLSQFKTYFWLAWVLIVPPKLSIKFFLSGIPSVFFLFKIKKNAYILTPE
jgi:hypothetical protein